jgi:hypothetical protein
VTQVDKSEKKKTIRLSIVLSSIPIVFCGVLTSMLGYDAPYWDQWWKIPLIVKSFEGTIVFGDYWMLINEHRVFFPNLLTIPLARATHWTIGYELTLTYLFGIVSFLVLCQSLLLGTDGTEKRQVWSIVPLISLLMFSYSQHNIWMWGLHIMIPMTLLAMIISIRNLIVPSIATFNFIIAVIFAVIASYSFGAGIVIWGVGAVILLPKVVLKNERAKRYFFLWCGACLVTMAVYFIGYESTESESTSLQAIMHPVSFFQYVIAYLGAPLAPIKGWASVIIGFSSIGYAVYFFKNIQWDSERDSPRVRMALGLMVFALGCAVLTGLKQWPEGPNQAISSRYLVWSTMFWVGLLILSTISGTSRFVQKLLITHVFILGMFGSLHGAYRADERHTAFELGKNALLTNTNESHLLYLYPTLDVPLQMRDDLGRYKLSIFRDTIERAKGEE